MVVEGFVPGGARTIQSRVRFLVRCFFFYIWCGRVAVYVDRDRTQLSMFLTSGVFPAVPAWLGAVRRWHGDLSRPNPVHSRDHGLIS